MSFGGNWRRGGGHRPAPRSVNPNVDPQKLLEDLGDQPPVRTWTVQDIVASQDGGQKLSISDRKMVASYNWHGSKLVVPGAPLAFFPWRGGVLTKFNECASADTDHDNAPSFPLEPMVTAMRVCQPKLKIGDFDFLAELYALEGLIFFSLNVAKSRRGAVSRMDKGSIWRMDVQSIGNTLFVARKYTEPVYIAGGCSVAFRKKCSKPPLVNFLRGGQLDEELVKGPFKMVSAIKLGGLNLLVGHETLVNYPTDPNDVDVVSTGNVPTESGVECIIAGYQGDLNALTQVYLGSRSILKQFFPTEKWFIQYLTGVTEHYVAFHNRGIFAPEFLKMESSDTISQFDGLDQELAEAWVDAFGKLLQEIIDAVRQLGSTAPEDRLSIAIIVDTMTYKIEIYRIGDTGDQNRKAVSIETERYLKREQGSSD